MNPDNDKAATNDALKRTGPRYFLPWAAEVFLPDPDPALVKPETPEVFDREQPFNELGVHLLSYLLTKGYVVQTEPSLMDHGYGWTVTGRQYLKVLGKNPNFTVHRYVNFATVELERFGALDMFKFWKKDRERW